VCAFKCISWNAWQKLSIQKKEIGDVIGPTCTVGAHNWFDGQCNVTTITPMKGEEVAAGSSESIAHVWPAYFTTQWDMYFVYDANNAPPYDPIPIGPNITVTHGQTYYDTTYQGLGAMREVYSTRCIPIFFTGVFSANNNFSCDFLNVASTQTAYMITHDDRPIGAPECCIIGQPFHPPPVNFASNMTDKSSQTIGGIQVDWNAITLPDAGIFNFGFVANSTSQGFSTPYVFYMMGAPQVASWLYQKFENFAPEHPSEKWWKIPESCDEAVVCPGWG